MRPNAQFIPVGAPPAEDSILELPGSFPRAEGRQDRERAGTHRGWRALGVTSWLLQNERLHNDGWREDVPPGPTAEQRRQHVLVPRRPRVRQQWRHELLQRLLQGWLVEGLPRQQGLLDCKLHRLCQPAGHAG